MDARILRALDRALSRGLSLSLSLSCWALALQIGAVGCLAGGSEEDATRRAFRLRPLLGIGRVEAPIPGVLELRPDHDIGAYDSILVTDGRIKYRKGSIRLTKDAEEAFVALLRNTMVDAVEQFGVRVAERPERCAMEVVLEVADLDLETRPYAENLADLVVVMRFRDSTSGRHLLRYARRQLVPHPETGVSDDRQLRREFGRIVREMNVANALRPAGLATDAKFEGCEGVLGDLGRAAATP